MYFTEKLNDPLGQMRCACVLDMIKMVALCNPFLFGLPDAGLGQKIDFMDDASTHRT